MMNPKSNNNLDKKPLCFGSDWEKAWDIYKANDAVFHNRIYFFLVAESMLFVSFATFTISFKTLSYQYIICILGVIYSLTWFLC